MSDIGSTEISKSGVLITDELYQRPCRPPNLEAEVRILRAIGQQLTRSPQAILKYLVEAAVDLCQAGTAGVSLIETLPSGEEVFRWVALAGICKSYEGNTTDREHSPCSVCLSQGSTQLYHHPERYFPCLELADPPIVEELVVPLLLEGQALGVIWIASHDQQRQFDGEDVRIMTSLADFTAVALQSSHLRQTAEETQQALQQSQARIQTLITNMPGMVYRYVPCAEGKEGEDRFSFINSACRDLFEVEPEAALQDAGSIWNQIHADDRASFQASVAAAVKGFLPWDWQGRVITPSGQLKWIQGRSSAVQTTDGAVWDGLLIDITERKQVEASLRESEELKQRILESSGDCIKVLTLDGAVLYMSQGGQCLLEVDDLASVLNLDWVGLWQGEDYQLAKAAIAAAKAGGMGQFQGYLSTMKGKPKWWDSVISPIRDESGNIVQLVAISRDITKEKQIEAKRQQAEQALREAHVQLESALAAGAVYTWRWNIPGDRVIVNAAFANLFAVDPVRATTEGLPIQLFVNSMHAEDRSRVFAAVQQAIDTGEEYTSEYRVQTARGEERWLKARGRVEYDAAGNPISFPGALVDITNAKRDEAERQQAQAALQESEARLRLAVKTAKLGSWQLDLKTYELLTSDQCKANYGLSLDADFSHQVLFERIHPDDRAWVAAAIQQSIEQRSDYDVEYRTIWDNDSLHWSLVRGRTLYDTDGTPLQMIGMSLDITDRKQAEEALRENERALTTLLGNLPGMVYRCLMDETYSFEFASEGCLELTGYHAADFGHNGRVAYADIMHPDDQDRIRAEVTPLLEQRQQFTVTYRIFTANGELRWVWDRGIGVYAPDGELIAVEGFVVDLTEFKQAETARRESEERYRTLFESIDSGFCIIEMLFDENSQPIDYCFLEINPAFEKQTGLINAQGKRMRELIPNHEEHWFEIYGKVALTGEPIRFENCAEALHRWYEVYACRIGQPEARKVAILFKDISEAKRIEAAREQLLQREQTAREAAEHANRIKDEFLAVLSHELRSPLNPILGWSNLLRNGRLDAAKTAHALETIERNAKLQVQLIEDLLDVSRILQGKLNLNIAPVNLVATIQAALETVQLATAAKSIQIKTVFDPEVGQVLGDSARLQQIIWNLLTNAIKFTPAGGEVEIKLQRVGAQAQIQIRDTGKGISPEFLPHVFEYFRQADSATTRKFGGLGLGLAIVHHLVELHGGTVQADSPGDGQGATFTVNLLLIQDTNQETEALGNSSPTMSHRLPLANLRVLVVDDTPDARELMAFTLEQSGAIVTSASSAVEALHAFEHAQFDILISDIGMPEIDGYMLMQQIRAMPAAPGKILAIALTAYAAEVDRQQALAAGFQQHVTKPIEPDKLVQTIVSLVEKTGIPAGIQT